MCNFSFFLQNHELKLKIVAMEANGVINCPPEHNTLQKTNKDLQEKVRAMSQVLSEYMTQSASLNMKALLVRKLTFYLCVKCIIIVLNCRLKLDEIL